MQDIAYIELKNEISREANLANPYPIGTADWHRFRLDYFKALKHSKKYKNVIGELIANEDKFINKWINVRKPKSKNQPIKSNHNKPKNKQTIIKENIRRQDKLCRYCMSAKATTVDHVIPKSKGGSNNQINLVGCCYQCNQVKGDRTPKEAQMKLYLPLRFYEYKINIVKIEVI